MNNKKLISKNYYIAPSRIHGRGLFANKDFSKGELIGLAHVDGQPTPEIGNLHNHDENTPTAISIKKGNQRYLLAGGDIKAGTELTTNYRMQPELGQPEEFMTPQKDGYRSYSPFQNLPYIDVNSNVIDTDNLAYDKLKLIGDNGVEKIVKNNSGDVTIPGAKTVREIPIAQDGIEVTDPADPRLHMYLDSLNLHQGMLQERIEFPEGPLYEGWAEDTRMSKGPNPNHIDYWDDSKTKYVFDSFEDYRKEYAVWEKILEDHTTKDINGFTTIDWDEVDNDERVKDLSIDKNFTFKNSEDLRKYSEFNKKIYNEPNRGNSGDLARWYEDNLSFRYPANVGYWHSPDLGHSIIKPIDSYMGEAWNPIYQEPTQPYFYAGDPEDVEKLRYPHYIKGVTEWQGIDAPTNKKKRKKIKPPTEEEINAQLQKLKRPAKIIDTPTSLPNKLQYLPVKKLASGETRLEDQDIYMGGARQYYDPELGKQVTIPLNTSRQYRTRSPEKPLEMDPSFMAAWLEAMKGSVNNNPVTALPDWVTAGGTEGFDFQEGGSRKAPSRKGVRLNYDEEGNVIGESSHIMRTETLDGLHWFSFPTLFQNEDGSWLDMSEESDKDWKPAMLEAKKRGELIHFGADKEEALAFGEGSWKDLEYEELDLTDEEIEEYKKGGYVVEELPKAQNGLTVSDPNHPRLTSYRDSLDLYNLSNDFKNKVEIMTGLESVNDPKDMRLLNNPGFEQKKNSYKLPSNPNISVTSSWDKDKNPTRDLKNKAVHAEFSHPTIDPTGLYKPYQNWRKWLTGKGPEYSAYNVTYSKPKQKVTYVPKTEKKKETEKKKKLVTKDIIDKKRSYTDAYENVDKKKYPTLESFIEAAENYKKYGSNTKPEEIKVLKSESEKKKLKKPIVEKEIIKESEIPEGYKLSKGYERDGISYGDMWHSYNDTSPSIPVGPTMNDYYIKYPESSDIADDDDLKLGGQLPKAQGGGKTNLIKKGINYLDDLIYPVTPTNTSLELLKMGRYFS